MQQEQARAPRAGLSEDLASVQPAARTQQASPQQGALRASLLQWLDKLQRQQGFAAFARNAGLASSILSCLLIAKEAWDGIVWDLRLGRVNAEYRDLIGIGERAALTTESYIYAALGLTALGLAVALAIALSRSASERAGLRHYWRERIASGAFIPLLLDEAIGKLLLQLHHQRLPGLAHLKQLPLDPVGHLEAVAVHAEALACADGHVEQLRQSDMRIVLPFGATAGWSSATVLMCAWVLFCTWAICAGRFFAGGAFTDPLFVLIALLMQSGPLAALEFGRLSSRIDLALISMLKCLTED